MVILGVDPGSHWLGWGVIEVGKSLGNMRHVASGTLQAPKECLVNRLVYLAEQLEGLIETHAPEQAAVEDAFFAKNAQSALVLGQARGAVLVMLGRAGLSVHNYSATHVKQAIVGRGHADKLQVQHMVHLVLGMRPQGTACATTTAHLDSSDALAVAICHAQHASSAVPTAPSPRGSVRR